MTTLPPFTADTGILRETARAIAGHMTALADGLEPAPDAGEPLADWEREALGNAPEPARVLTAYRVEHGAPGESTRTETVYADQYTEDADRIRFWGHSRNGCPVASFAASRVAVIREVPSEPTGPAVSVNDR